MEGQSTVPLAAMAEYFTTARDLGELSLRNQLHQIYPDVQLWRRLNIRNSHQSSTGREGEVDPVRFADFIPGGRSIKQNVISPALPVEHVTPGHTRKCIVDRTKEISPGRFGHLLHKKGTLRNVRCAQWPAVQNQHVPACQVDQSNLIGDFTCTPVVRLLLLDFVPLAIDFLAATPGRKEILSHSDQGASKRSNPPHHACFLPMVASSPCSPNRMNCPAMSPGTSNSARPATGASNRSRPTKHAASSKWPGGTNPGPCGGPESRTATR
ncbi:hypothetical protein SAMN05216267_1001325 [Actinacidiphila rubida]|uniref:Uncharacterized protein n=1 Tax=Actinacidiphila rubida TaxID=310780 RepID=A0A1H8DVL8_9ACTN|nr:hypothetical protein SAMN05216267_1001325 [Actinacidiphila rubida]